MKQPQYAVKSLEFWPVTVEEYDAENRDLRTRRRTMEHTMTTLCNSYEEAMEFLQEINTRQHPQVKSRGRGQYWAWYAGRVL